MADVNYLQKVNGGESIKASVINSNNNYLDNKIDTTNQNLTEILTGIKTSLQSQIETNNTNLTNNLKTLEETLNTTIENSTTVNGNSIKFENGIVINWGAVGGMGNNSNSNITWSTPFVGGYCVSGAANYNQWAGNKGSTWSITNMQSTYISIRSAFEENGGHTIWAIAVGRWK